MKTPRVPVLAIFICNVLFFTSIATGQSVTINSISGTSFCTGDSISVHFTATGFWGHRNAFTLELSDPTGSFNNGFLNIGSLIDTLPGTFTINWTIPANTTPSTNYRFRILAAIPYTTSADNGSDISIGTSRAFGIDDVIAGSIGTPITFTAGDIVKNRDAPQENVFWDFGSGATPATATTSGIFDGIQVIEFSQDVTYSTPGDKTVTLSLLNAGGCTPTVTYPLHIYDCSIPSIPRDAIVIDSNTIIGSSKTYWANPGVTLNGANNDTIFAEPGSTISGARNCILYIKQGSVFTSSLGQNSVIFGDGASINTKSNDFTLHCPALDFDYTNAPPNAAHPADAVANTSLPSLTISPNPTRGIISIQGAPSNDLNISVMNLLGETIMQLKNPHSPDFTLDLSKLVSGTYYVRFSSANSVVTKMVVRE